ncbi:MAG: thioesterase family protein [Pseudomonadales bacterium]|nr:thioesterase family protein [Halieaceae bacterium]MCP5165423.1 thioesterase family protein [Pseudomonadales bacterium]MCP5190765.1 thioesterase family protein [Pseudomonadales bacterium]
MSALQQLIEVITPKQDGADRFVGANMHPEGFRVYGGQVLAQAVSAAVSTVAEDRAIHSQHAYFLRPGDVRKPIVLEVERARDGGSFSSRRVVASQDDKPILVSSMSFQAVSRGDDFQPPMPQVVPPDSLASERQLSLEAGSLDESFMITTGEDLDIRVVNPIDWNNLVPRAPILRAWMKTTAPVADEPRLHQALLTYMSDAFLVDVCLITHGRRYDDANWQVASLDHALWFHEPFRADEWLLHIVETERTGGGRGLARGSFYAIDGRLVATTMQQSLIRRRQD